MRKTLLLFARDPGTANQLVALYELLCSGTVNLRTEGDSSNTAMLLTMLTEGWIPNKILFAARDAAALILKNADLKPAEGLGQDLLKAPLQVFQKNRISTVVTGLSDRDDRTPQNLWRAARDCNGRSFAIADDATLSLTHAQQDLSERFRDSNGTKIFPDTLCVLDEKSRKAVIAAGAQPETVLIIGNLHLQRFQRIANMIEPHSIASLRSEWGGNNEKDILLYASEPITQMREYGKKRSHNELSLLEELIRQVKNKRLVNGRTCNANTMIVIRPHPRDNQKKFQPYTSDRGPRVIVSRRGSSAEAVLAADIVIGITSMLLVEAAALKRPTLSLIGFDPDPSAHQAFEKAPSQGEFSRLDGLFDRLFPICRSITGPGLRESLTLISESMPLQIETTATATRVFDWVVPQEWLVHTGHLTGPDGKVYADFERSNLEIVNYSSPVDAKLSLEQLKGHLHTIPCLPSAIPYVTSYYKRNWGFCIPYELRTKMPVGEYHAHIDSEFVDGGVNFAHCSLPGETSRGIWLTSYLCHPSLANNELSGPLALTELYRRISSWKRRRYTYYFVMAPETIGTLCYLAKYQDFLKKNMESGMVVTCVGGPASSMSYKQSRKSNSLIDRTVEALATKRPSDFNIRTFDPSHGSDERQYCAPGFNFPMGQISRTPYGTYDGYHNSLDTKDFMTITSLIDSVSQIEEILLTAEISGYFRNTAPFGEPQLGRRGLYPTTNSPANRDASMDQKRDGRKFLDRLLYVLNYSDGEHDMLSIAKMCGCQISDLAPVIRTLEEQGLLQLITKDKA